MKQDTNNQNSHQVPWNKGKLIGQKSPLKLKEIWEIRIRLQMAKNTRELALFNLAIDSKLRGCDLVTLRISDVAQSNRVSSRAIIMQQKTHRPVQCIEGRGDSRNPSVKYFMGFARLYPYMARCPNYAFIVWQIKFSIYVVEIACR